MIERILEVPISSCKKNNNKELESKLILIKESIRQQINIQNQMYQDKSIISTENENNESEDLMAIKDNTEEEKKEGSEYDSKSEYYDSEEEKEEQKSEQN